MSTKQNDLTHSLCSLQNRTTQPETRQNVRETRRNDDGKQNVKEVKGYDLEIGRGDGGEGTGDDCADGIRVVVDGEKHFLGMEMHELAA